MTTIEKKHKNIPIFIPHMGCPHCCVFCDQRTISGHTAFDERAVQTEIETGIATLPSNTKAEIAFFGGSFTAIDRNLMVRLLEMAQHYVNAGCVQGIRFSTRPDAVGEDILDILDRYSISAVELGLQSMDDEVLLATRRGHTASQAMDACRRIVARGYELVGQIMIGLPKSTPEKEMLAARTVCDLGAGAVRIYPTVVLRGTALARLADEGRYRPLSVEDAVDRCADMLLLFEARNVGVLRVGLCSSDGFSEEQMLGGAYHPALGELAYARLFRRKMAELLTRESSKKPTFIVARGRTSQAVGQHRENVLVLCREFQLERMDVRESEELSGTQIMII